MRSWNITSSAVVVDEQIQTSADDGKGKEESFMYSDKTVLRRSPKKVHIQLKCLINY